MTRVHGELFADGRSGVLVIRPSKPFFGCDKSAEHYPVDEGFIDMDLLPTPPGHEYLVGFKREGDYRETNYTLRWRVPDQESIDITAKKVEKPADPSVSSIAGKLHAKRLGTELLESMALVGRLNKELQEAKEREAKVTEQFQAHKAFMEESLRLRDQAITASTGVDEPVVQTVIKEVPVPPEPLQKRIRFLESEVTRLQQQSDLYYESVVELHQLKLERATSLPSSAPVSVFDGSPQQRLINKLLSN